MAVAAFVAVSLSACSFLELAGGGLPPVVADVEIFNRTLDDLAYVAADGERLDVPACGHARDKTFRVERVEVRAPEGYVRAFGVGSSDAARGPLRLVERARADQSGIPTSDPLPVPLPACDAPAEVQIGV